MELYLHSSNTPSSRGAQLSTGTTLPLTLPLLSFKAFFLLGLLNANINAFKISKNNFQGSYESLYYAQDVYGVNVNI
jgi:hypothetical protein